MKIIINGESVDIPGGSSTPSESLPIGSVIMWAGTLETIPTGWHLCDGTEGTIDLRGMFALGAGGTYSLGDSGGSEEVTLTLAQMPRHAHAATYYIGNGGTNRFYTNSSASAVMRYANSSADISDRTTEDGNSQPHPNMPPYKALYYIQKIA